MSAPTVLHKKAYFRREGAGCSQTSRPTLGTSDEIGQVLSVSGARESEEVVYEKEVNGVWVDYWSANQRDRQAYTITLNDTNPLFWELVEAVDPTWTLGGSGYSASFTDTHRSVTMVGWLRLLYTNLAGSTVADIYRWVKLDMESWDLPQTGLVNPTFTAKVLYSSLAQGSFANVS